MGGGQLVVQQLDTSNAFTLNSYLQSTGGLVKAGNGTLNLTAPQYFTGTTTVNGGMLTLGTLNALTVLPTITVPTLLNLAVNSLKHISLSESANSLRMWNSGANAAKSEIPVINKE